MLYGFSFFRKEGEAVQDKFYVELRLSVLLGNNDFFILPASIGQDIGHDVYARLQCRQADSRSVTKGRTIEVPVSPTSPFR